VGGNNGGYSDTNEEYDPGAAGSFTGLIPNTKYSFTAKARNAIGAETGESVTVSTYTLAAVPGAAAAAFTAVYASSFTVNWQGGDNPAGTTYYLQLSTATDFSAVAFSSMTLNSGLPASGLFSNTTYYARVAAINGGGLYTDYLQLGSTVTRIETPASVYFDEIGSTTILASAYAAAFTGLERGVSGVNIATGGVYGVWGSTGNYWTDKAPMLTARYEAAGGVIGGRLYVVGGYNNSTVNEEYDPAANIWTTKTAMPTGRHGLAVGIMGGKLYAVGGGTGVGGYFKTNEEYDPATNAWATKAAMPTAHKYFSVSAIGGKLYAVGGSNGTGALNVNEEYDPAANTWVTKAVMLTARGAVAAGVINGRLYAVGGGNGSNYYSTNEEYDPAADAWQTKAPMPAARVDIAIGVIGGKLYAVGGFDGSRVNTSEEYDPAADSWMTKTAMPSSRDGMAAGVIGGKLYAVGGSDGVSTVNTTGEYTPGVARKFSGLVPNVLYTFQAKARNQAGTETGESATVSTYTLAAVAPSAGAAFTEVFASSVAVNWSSGTAAGGFNGPDASYLVQASSTSDFSKVAVSSSTPDLRLSTLGLLSNTTYYFRAQAYNKLGVTDYSWLVLGSTVTQAIIPAAAAPAFTAVYESSYTVHWDPNGNSAGTGYAVQVSTSEDFIPVAASSDTTGTQFAASGLAVNTSYYARVAAVSANGVYTDYFVIGATVTAIATPADIIFTSVSSNTIAAQAYVSGGFINLDKGLSGISQARDAGAFGGWEQTAVATFGGLAPNKLYSFKAKARNQNGAETAESAAVSTYTLAAVSLPVSGPVFSGVYLTSATVNWSSGTAAGGFNGPDAYYNVQASTSPDSIPDVNDGQTSDLSAVMSGLWPNTTHYYRVQAYNKPGVTDYSWLALGSTSTVANPVTGAAIASVFSTSVTVNWNALPLTPSSGTCEGYSVEASTAPDFTGTVLSSATDSRQLAALSVAGLFASTTYYFRAGSLNWNALPNYAAAVSTKTRTEVEPPTMVNHEVSDYTWYRQNTKAYNVDFADTGGSALAKFMVKAATGTNGTGMIPGADWTNVETDISSNAYTADWQLPNGFWDLLAEGVTNYISVSVYDGAANSSTTLDAFKVFKDTTPPSIVEGVDDTAWQNAPGAPNSLDFSDGVSRLDRIQYAAWSLPGQAGAQLVPWTDIALNLGLSGYTTDYMLAPASWTLLQSGTNYLALRAWDYAVTANTATLVDAFVVLKDTAAPAAINTLAGVELSSYSARLGFAAPADAFSGIAEFAVQYASYTVAWSTSAVAGSSHVYVSTSGVTAGGSRAVEIAALGPNTTYYFRAWARDKAGNWSADSNSDPEVTLAAPPAGAAIADVYVSSLAAAWGLMDSAGYILDASTAANFSGTVLSSSTPDAAVVKLVVGGLSPNTTYYLRAGALNWAGAVTYSEAGSTSTYAIQPGSAAVFTAVTSVGITVEWLANGNPAGTRYLVQESTNELLNIEVSSVVPGFTFAFDGLAPSTTYTFMVTAMNNNGALSEPLLLGSTVTMPVPPVITEYTLWAASAAVAWAAGGNGEGTVYECDLSTAMDFAGALVSSSTYSTSLTMAPLLGNTSYYMRLRAVSPAGARTSYSTTDGLTPAAAPAWLEVLTLGPNSAGLYWDASGNSGGAANSAWSPGANLPAVRYGHAAAVAGDRLYISGGTDGAGYKADVWYAPLTPAGQLGAWTQTRGMPAARYGHTMTALKGRLYIMGGFNGVPQSTVWSAPVSSSGAAGAWVAETPLPHAVYAHAAVAFGDFIYILGGYGAAPVTEVLYSRVNNDGTLAGWNYGPVLPGNRYSHAAALLLSAAGARLCAAGGNDGTSARAEVWTAAVNSDGSLVPWVTGPALPAGVFAHSMAAVPGAVFVAGGNNGSGVRAAVWRAAVGDTGALSGWTTAAALPLARQSLAMAERGGRLLALGGFDGSVSKLETWALPVTGTEYRLEITGASFSSTPWLAAGNLELGALAPNASHTFRVYARNLAGTESLSPVVLSTYTYAAQPSSAPFADVGISSAQAAWLPNDNPAGTSYEAQLSSDAAYALLAGSSVTANAYAVIYGLGDNITYYGRARAFNAAGVATAWTSLGTVTTRTNPGLDTEKPSMISHQAGDTVWRNSASGIYDIDFADTGGAYLANFQVRASTSPGGIGPFSPDWVDVVTGINSNSYTADFSLEPSTFALLAAGTNYISVRVFDGNNNSSATVDAFYILKDTVAPVITDSQTGETEWRLTDGGTLYNVDFNDAASGLAAVEYSASANQGAGDAAALAWTPIAALTPGTSYYNADWPVDFAGLANDATNYISVRAWDMAGNTVTVSGIDVFKVLKFVSGPDVAITLPASAYRSSLTLITGTASDARSQTLKGTEVAVMDAAAGRYWDGAVFTAVLPKWAAAAGTSAWSYVPGVPWADGTAYLVVARSSDVAGNYSIVYASSPFTFDAAAPAVSPAAPADGATVDSVAAFSGTASDAVSGPAGLALKLKRLPDGKWWDFNAGTWTVSGSSAAAAGTAAWSYAPSALLKASLGTHTSYYFTLYAADNAVPANAAQFGVYGSTFVFLDDIAPAAITDLTASSGSAPGRINLAWTAPGDDGDGGLILYGEWRVQYSTEEAAVFSTAAAQVITGFSAVSPGTVLTYPLTGLEPGGTYFMRAWTRDDAGNWAPLSNGATTQATPYPDRISGHVMKVSSEGITGV
ncbi:MAG: fibronectin type III domain-containing protein, partial [Elusimicrobiota bacterium]